MKKKQSRQRQNQKTKRARKNAKANRGTLYYMTPEGMKPFRRAKRATE